MKFVAVVAPHFDKAGKVVAVVLLMKWRRAPMDHVLLGSFFLPLFPHNTSDARHGNHGQYQCQNQDNLPGLVQITILTAAFIVQARNRSGIDEWHGRWKI